MSNPDLTEMDDWQLHYVVQFDATTGKFYVDADTTYAMFHAGQVFVPGLQEWYDPSESDDPRGFNLIGEIETQLNEQLAKEN